MSKKRRISYLRERIMCDIEKVNLILNIITSHRVEKLSETILLSELAYNKCKIISKNSEKIGKILGC